MDRSLWSRIPMAAALAVSGSLLLCGGQAMATEGPSAVAMAMSADGEVQYSPPNEHGQYRYLIEFSEPGLLHRQTGRAAGQRVDMDAPGMRAARQELMGQQAGHRQAIASQLGRTPEITHHYLMTHSGIAVWLAPDEVERVMRLPEVVAVERERVYELNTYAGPWLIGADSIWDGTATPDNTELRGEGMVIAVIDTGIDPDHPAFANVAACEHGGSNPDKLISFLDCHGTDAGGVCNGSAPQDGNNHGTHVAATAAGNALDPSATPPAFTDIAGVAPCAHIRSYRGCGPGQGCNGAALTAALNNVPMTGDVDVMNYSVSGGTSPWNSNDGDRLKLDLVEADILVAASSGNTTAAVPNPVGQVNHRGPWVMTVAASTHDGPAGIFSISGPGDPPAATQNVTGIRGSNSPFGASLSDHPIRRFDDQPAEFEGCTAGQDGAPGDLDPFPEDFFAGAVALIHRGTCPFTTKITNAFDAGADMVIIRNNAPGDISMATPGQADIPAYSINQAAGNAMRDFVDANPTTATIDFDLVPGQPDVLAGFSFRGPTPGPLQHLTKPDITAPGVDIYAPVVGDYGTISGTSMSSPHAAGAAALVRQAHPDWTVSEVKSALMMTSDNGGTKEDGTTPWDADDVGSGRVDLTGAALAGLVMDETIANYLAANPATGGDVRTLNLPALRNLDCTPSCTWTRTVRNTLDQPTQWQVDSNFFSGDFNVVIDPPTFDFSGDDSETQTVTVTVTPVGDQTSSIHFGELVLTEAGSASPELHWSIAVSGLSIDGAFIEVDPASFNVTLPEDGATTEPLTIGNNLGTEDLEWEIAFTGARGTMPRGTVLWDQAQSSNSGFWSNFFNPIAGGTGIYSADDFVLSGEASLSSILARGFRNAGPLADGASDISWFIFPDDGGEPAGDPENSPEMAVWSFTTTPGGAGVSLADNHILLDLAAAGETVELPAGHYWLSVFPHMNNDTSDPSNSWFWFSGAPVQLENAMAITPGSAFGGAVPDWTDIVDILDPTNPDFEGLAFRLTGALDLACEQAPPAWLSLSDTSGTVSVGDETVVDVTFNAAGLAPGTYETLLCVESNAENSALVLVPVTLEVTEVAEPGELTVEPETLEFGEVPVGLSLTASLTVTHVAESGAADLELALIELLHGDPAFSLLATGSCEAGEMLAPGDSCTVDVNFAPDAIDAFTGAVRVESVDGQQVTAGLSGDGTELMPGDDDVFRDRFQVPED